MNASTNKIAKKTHTKDKLYQTFKLTKLHVDQDNYRQAQNTFKIWFEKKENTFLEEEIKATTANPGKFYNN